MSHTHAAPLADCVTCGRPSDAELAICAPCLDDAQQTIIDTRDYLAQMPETTREVMGLRAIRYDKPAAGNPDDGDLPFGLNVLYDDPEDRRISAIRQPETALDILHGWAAGWADQRGDQVGNVFDYLAANTRWAAQHDAGWRDYLTEIRQVRNVIRRLAGLAPERQASPCPECGGPVVQEWTATGLDDALHCTRCSRAWPTFGRFVIATANTIAAVPDEHPDLLVTTTEARMVLSDLKRNTLNVWLKRDREREEGVEAKIPPHGAMPDGSPLYKLSDITKLHRGTTTEGATA